MNNQFDELAKGLAQSVTRRAALKKFGLGIAGLGMAALGLAKAAAAESGKLGPGERCGNTSQCQAGLICIAFWPSPGPQPKKNLPKYCMPG